MTESKTSVYCRSFKQQKLVKQYYNYVVLNITTAEKSHLTIVVTITSEEVYMLLYNLLLQNNQIRGLDIKVFNINLKHLRISIEPQICFDQYTKTDQGCFTKLSEAYQSALLSMFTTIYFWKTQRSSITSNFILICPLLTCSSLLIHYLYTLPFH